MTVAGQEPVYYKYDANSRLSEILASINGVTQSFGFQYDELGRRISLSLPNGITTTYNYDNGSNLLEILHKNPAQILEQLVYNYDQNGNRTSMDRVNVPVKLPNPANNIAYNSANQMLTFNDKTITYDNNGNMTSVTNSCGTTVYDWDARNRLIGMAGFDPNCQPLIASFKYDALGRRIEKRINEKTIHYLYDGLDIIQEIENGIVSANYIRNLNIDEPLARIQSDGTVRYYQQDALGSVIALLDENGEEKTQYSYDPYGNVEILGELSDNPFQYTGRENDGTGLYYYRARYYSPELQRFVSEDRIGLRGQDVNLFRYVFNQPTNNNDPLGLLSSSSSISNNVDPNAICTTMGCHPGVNNSKKSKSESHSYKIVCDWGILAAGAGTAFIGESIIIIGGIFTAVGTIECAAVPIAAIHVPVGIGWMAGGTAVYKQGLRMGEKWCHLEPIPNYK